MGNLTARWGTSPRAGEPCIEDSYGRGVDREISQTIERLTGSRVASANPLSGGDVAAAYRVDLADGSRVFAKTKAGADPSFFATEAAGLRWLGEPSVIPVPQVIGVGDDVPLLALEWIEPGSPTPTTEADFGRALAALHQAGPSSFGRADNATTGSLELPNTQHATWAQALADNRLRPLARIGLERGAYGQDEADDLERVADRLPDLVPEEPPARLHGDLWAGNRMIGAGGRSWLIDPAAHGGHREFDLAMMDLFGGFGPACYAAYDDAFPLADGWRDRIPLHQLAPLAVHAIKFGGGYRPALRRALEATLTTG